MALAISNRGSTFTTTAGNKSVTWAGATAGHFIAIVAAASGMTGADNITVADDQGDGGTYVEIVRATGGGTDGLVIIFLRSKNLTTTASTIFTATITGDTGGGLWVGGITGMGGRGGTQAAKQSKAENLQTESPPSFSFTSVCQNGVNGGIVAILGEDNPPALTAPANWPESIDTGYATPATGIVINTRNTLAGDQTLNWTAGALTDHCEVGVEIDESAPPVAAGNQFMMIGPVGI